MRGLVPQVNLAEFRSNGQTISFDSNKEDKEIDGVHFLNVGKQNGADESASIDWLNQSSTFCTAMSFCNRLLHVEQKEILF